MSEKEQIFICHSTDNKPILEQIVKTYEDGKYKPWVSSVELSGGMAWWKKVTAEIGKSSLMVVLWSSLAAQSPYCIEEIFIAQRKRIPILPCIIEGRWEVPEWLSHIQNINIASGKLSDYGANLIGTANVLIKRHAHDNSEDIFWDGFSGLRSNEINNQIDEFIKNREFTNAYYYLLYLLYERRYEPKQTKKRIERLKERMDNERKNKNKKNQEIASHLQMDWVSKDENWVWIPAGSYISEGEEREIDYNFYMMKYPITGQNFLSFTSDETNLHNKGAYYTPRYWKHSHSEFHWFNNHKHLKKAVQGRLEHPMTMVNWYECVAFTRWLQEVTNLRLSLPTTWERLRAIQGDEGYDYPWGNKYSHMLCNVRQSQKNRNKAQRGTTAVDRYPKGVSPFGVYDLVGNVWEWIIYEDLAKYKNTSEIKEQQIHGGGWRSRKRHLHHSFIRSKSPTYEAPDLGFRLVRLDEFA